MIDWLGDYMAEVAATLTGAAILGLFASSKFREWLKNNGRRAGQVAVVVLVAQAPFVLHLVRERGGGAQGIATASLIRELDAEWRLSVVDSFASVQSLNHWTVGHEADPELGGYDVVLREALRVELEACEREGGRIAYHALKGYDDVRDGYVEVDGRVLKGLGGTKFGIFFRAGDAGRYLFELAELGGWYTLYRRDADQWVPLVEQTLTPAIVPGRPHRLGVRFEGPRIELYIDGQLVRALEDDALATGTVGLSTDYDCPPGTILELDNFKLYTPG